MFGLRLAGSGKVISKMTYNLLSGALNTTNILSRIRILCGQIGMFLAVALCLGLVWFVKDCYCPPFTRCF